jgi:signal transduction histidine kinase
MLMEDELLSEKQLEELMKTHQTLEYITKLNKSLLLLTKIDNRQFTDIKQLKLNMLLKRYLQDYEEVYHYRNIKTSIEEQDVFNIMMNESLAVALLTNLLKNAFVHNVDRGHIRIVVSKNNITFRNTGVEHPLDKEHIFYQGAKKEGSTGLGLAIAASICRLQHLILRYYYEQGEHCFEISSI